MSIRRSLKSPSAALLLASSLLLAACATTPSAQVARFHTGVAPSPGTVFIKPAKPEIANSIEFSVQANAIAAQFNRAGYQAVTSPGLAAYNAVVDVSVTERTGIAQRTGLSIGLGGGFSSRNVGIGTGVSIPVGGKTKANVDATTTLSVSMHANPDNRSVWEGRSSLETKAGSANGTQLVPVLAETLFRDFPGPSGKTTTVPIR